MRVTTDKPDNLTAKANIRRRVYLIAFAVFCLVAVLSLIPLATSLSRKLPLDDLSTAAGQFPDLPRWTVRLDPMPAPVRERLVGVGASDEELDRLTQVLRGLQPVALVLSDVPTDSLLDAEEETPLVVVLGIRRPQRVFRNALTSALEGWSALEHDLEYSIGERYVILATGPGVLDAVRVGLAEAPPPSGDPAPRSGPTSWLTYEGPASLLPAELLAQHGLSPDTDIRIVWPSPREPAACRISEADSEGDGTEADFLPPWFAERPAS